MRLSRPLTAVAFVAPVVAAFLVWATGFGIAWDFLNYHYYDAFALLHDRSRDIAPAGLHTYFNPTIEIPFYLSITLLPPWAAALLFGAFSGLNITLAFLASKAALRAPNGAILAALGALFAALSMNFAVEFASVNHDNLVSLFLLGGFIPLFQAMRGRRVLLLVAVSGCVIGLGVGLKYTLAPFLIGTGAFLPLLFRGKLSFREIVEVMVVFAAAALVGALMTAGWWMLHLWQAYRNPFFPLFNGFFRSPYAAPVSYADHRFQPRSVLELLAFPFLFARDAAKAGVKMPVHDYRYAVAYAGFIIAAAVLVVRRFRRAAPSPCGTDLMSPNAAWFLIAMTALSYIVWQAAFSVSRYLLPLDMILPLVALACLQVLGLTSRAWLALWALGFVALGITADHPLEGEHPWNRQLMTADVPPLPHPKATLIVLAGTSPMSYLIPDFPSDVSFVRISLQDGFGPAASGGITAIDSPALLSEQAREAIASHRGALYVMFGGTPKIEGSENAIVAKTLERLNLKVTACQLVLPSLRYERQRFWLCALRRI